jgi:hypothetical protein
MKSSNIYDIVTTKLNEIAIEKPIKPEMLLLHLRGVTVKEI